VIARGAARHWGHLAIQTALLLAGVVLLQVVAERTDRRIDLTPGAELSLAALTERILAEVAAPLEITVFHRRGTRARYAALLARLEAANPLVRSELLDLDRHPERARALGVGQYGLAAVRYEGRHAVVPALPEDALATGLVQVLRGESRRVAFTTGHGERSPGDQIAGYGRFVDALAAENYRAAPISLAGGDVPDDADVVIVAGPRHDFLPGERERLAAYLARGGSALLLLEPGPLPELAALLDGLGIRIADDAVVDPDRSVVGTGGLTAVVELFKQGNPVFEAAGVRLESGAVLPSARSVDVVREVPGVAAESIARTAPTAWIVSGAERARRGGRPDPDAGDVPGGASVLVMAEVGTPRDGGRPGRLVVVGDADFASDGYLDLLGNRDLAMNAMAWLADESMLAGERATAAHEVFRPLSPLVLTERQARALLVGVAFVQPALVLLAGVLVVGLRRRHG
jgi:ABC-type uncharacterized transport system involved in gliding motility auxiliary subunit